MNKEKTKDRLGLAGLINKARKLKPYLWLILLAFFVIIYGFVIFKINSYLNQQPSASMLSSELKTTTRPAINQNVVNQLEQLQNNSVSVQSLFNQARQNPFQ